MKKTLLLLSVLTWFGCGPSGVDGSGPGPDDGSLATRQSEAVSSLAAAADATVRSGSFANTNYGRTTTLSVDGNNGGTVQRAYLLFQVTSIPAGTTSVRLALPVVRGGVPGTLYSTSSFSETAITWNNRPSRIAPLGSSGAVASGGTLRFDVTSAVTRPGTYAFALASTDPTGIVLGARESSAKPVLEFNVPGSSGGCAAPTTSVECDVFNQINQARAGQGLPALRFNTNLRAAAVNHNNYMVSHNCFDHVCAGEANVGTRITNAGYSWSAYGETIAAGYPTAAAVVNGWLNSRGHRAILLGNYRDVGVSQQPCSSGCTYNPYWTADFGNPR